jgi:hypothetical protein
MAGTTARDVVTKAHVKHGTTLRILSQNRRKMGSNTDEQHPKEERLRLGIGYFFHSAKPVIDFFPMM